VSLAPDRCVTCSDEAVEAEVLQLDGLTAIVAVDGERESVGIDLVPTAAPGDVLLCHAGIALARLGSPTGRPAEADHLPAR
jgi:hydrogenase expression/formation protein HypC